MILEKVPGILEEDPDLFAEAVVTLKQIAEVLSDMSPTVPDPDPDPDLDAFGVCSLRTQT